jgi:hypothetical protein
MRASGSAVAGLADQVAGLKFLKFLAPELYVLLRNDGTNVSGLGNHRRTLQCAMQQ